MAPYPADEGATMQFLFFVVFGAAMVVGRIMRENLTTARGKICPPRWWANFYRTYAGKMPTAQSPNFTLSEQNALRRGRIPHGGLGWIYLTDRGRIPPGESGVVFIVSC